MKLQRFHAVAAIFTCLIAVPASRATVMVSNLAETTFSSFPVGVWWAGNRFITDSSAPSFQLDSVTLSMDAASATDGGFFVAIYSDGIGEPGSLLGTLSGSSNPAAAGQYTCLSTGLSLAANTSYWVVAGAGSGGGTYNWNLTGDPFSYTGPWQIPATDTHITSFSAGGDNWNTLPNDSFPRQFSISATAVPEPTISTLLMMAGTLALGIVRRRKLS